MFVSVSVFFSLCSFCVSVSVSVFIVFVYALVSLLSVFAIAHFALCGTFCNFVVVVFVCVFYAVDRSSELGFWKTWFSVSCLLIQIMFALAYGNCVFCISMSRFAQSKFSVNGVVFVFEIDDFVGSDCMPERIQNAF